MGRQVDLDAIEAEATGDPTDVTVGGVTWRVLPELPLSALEALRRDDLHGCLALVTVDESEGDAFADAVCAGRVTHTQVLARISAMFKQDTGESSAS